MLIFKQLLYTLLILGMLSATQHSSKSIKCMIQLTNYDGEGAYCTISLLDKEDNYVETLYVLGDDTDWYPDIEEWYSFYENNQQEIDGITGASISVGKRKIVKFSIDDDKMNTGYKLRFETAVEDQKYHKKDVEIELSNDVFNKKIEGTGYIRYIRMK